MGLDAYDEPRTTLVVDHGLEVISDRRLALISNYLRMLALFNGMRTCAEASV